MNHRASDAICTALQLANFWQDVALDWRKGRIYVPLEDLARFSLDTDAIARGICDARWSRLMAFETARTRALFDDGAAAYAQGNYEVVSARCAEGSGELLVDAAVRLLKELYGKE